MSTVTTTEVTSAAHMKNASMPILADNGQVNMEALTPSDIERYKKIGASLVVTDINSVTNYGSELQNVMNQSSTDMLNAVRAPKCGEIGTLITHLLSELEYVDIDELKEPSAMRKFARQIPIVRRFITSVKTVLDKYDTISNNVDTIAKKIAVTRISALKDNTSLQMLFTNNQQYCAQIEELIIAGQIKLKEMREQLGEMIANQANYKPHEIKDVEEFANNLERRIHDLMLLRHVMTQSLFQIRTVQYNNIRIADKAQSIIGTTIPLWKNQLSIAVALNTQRNNMEAQRKVSDATNTILKKNAEMLHYTSIEVAKENERGVVDIETFRDSTRQLIDTVKEVQQIALEGHAKRENAVKEIMSIEKELENNIKNLSTKAMHGHQPMNLLVDGTYIKDDSDLSIH